jgi:hypothetical protein
VFSPRAAYRRWACNVPEGTRRRDWRLHPLWIARSRSFVRDVPMRVQLWPAICECLGLPFARFGCEQKIRFVPWGARSRNDYPLRLRPPGPTREQIEAGWIPVEKVIDALHSELKHGDGVRG